MVKAVTGLRARVRTSGGTRMSRAKTPSAMAQKGHGRDLTAAPRPRSARQIALMSHSPSWSDYRRSGPTARGSHPDAWRREWPARRGYTLSLASTPANIGLLHPGLETVHPMKEGLHMAAEVSRRDFLSRLGVTVGAAATAAAAPLVGGPT